MKEWIGKYRIKLLCVALALLILGGFWQVFADKVSKAMQDNLITTIEQRLNGRLQVGSIDLSLLSMVRIRDVALYDKNNILVAKSPSIEIKYQWSSLANGKLGMSSIEVMAIQGAEIWLKSENQRWSWQDIMKDEKGGIDYRGKVLIADGVIHIGNALIMQKLEGINGTLDFATYPAALGVDLKGRSNQAKLSLLGNWGDNHQSELILRTDGFDVAKLTGLLPATQEVRLEKGILKNVKVIAKHDEKRTVHYQAEGEFSALTATGKINIHDGQGKFTADKTGLQFYELALYISGQQAKGKGSIMLLGDKQSLNFSFTLSDIDPAAIFDGLAVKRPLSAAITVTGPLTKPLVSGSFQIPQLTISNMSVSGITGNMRYENGQITLKQVRGTALQGILAMTGELLTENKSYELDVSGSGMNSSALTDKDVHGPLDFTGHVSGRGEAAVVKGDFLIYNGKAYGIPFKTLNGKFFKQGATTDISGVTISTSVGTFYPEQLNREALEKLSQYNIPTSKDEVRKALADTLVRQILR